MNFTGHIMVNEEMKNAIVLFAKEPDGFSAKTRIAKNVGKEKAAEIYNELLTVTANVICDFDCHISYTGVTDPIKLKSIFVNVSSFFKQVEGDLGERMRTAFKHLFNMGYESVTALGTDCPYLSKDDLLNTAKYLSKENRVVVGPASDGGYYLIGCRKETFSVLNTKKWSTPDLFEETLSIIKTKGYNYLSLEMKDDIDEIEDFLKYKKKDE